MKTLTFLTVTSGNSQPTSRSDVKQFVVSQLYPLVEAGGGDIPGLPGWSFRVTPVAGGAFFSINTGPDIVVAGGVACTGAAAAELWPHLEKFHLTNYQGLAQRLGAQNVPDAWLANPVEPTQLPWLAVVLQPGILKHPFAAVWLADFERCLAWCIVDQELPQN